MSICYFILIVVDAMNEEKYKLPAAIKPKA